MAKCFVTFLLLLWGIPWVLFLLCMVTWRENEGGSKYFKGGGSNFSSCIPQISCNFFILQVNMLFVPLLMPLQFPSRILHKCKSKRDKKENKQHVYLKNDKIATDVWDARWKITLPLPWNILSLLHFPFKSPYRQETKLMGYFKAVATKYQSNFTI